MERRSNWNGDDFSSLGFMYEAWAWRSSQVERRGGGVGYVLWTGVVDFYFLASEIENNGIEEW